MVGNKKNKVKFRLEALQSRSPTGAPEGFCLQYTGPPRVTEKQQQQMTSILCDCSLSPLQHNSFGSTTPSANYVWSSSRRGPSPTTGATDAAGTTHWRAQSLLSQLSSVLFNLPHIHTSANTIIIIIIICSSSCKYSHNWLSPCYQFVPQQH